MATEAKWRDRYNRKRASIKHYRQEWAFDYESWRDIWRQSGLEDRFGNDSSSIVMTRIDEIEAWGPHNVVLLVRESHRRWNTNKKILRRSVPSIVRMAAYVPPTAEKIAHDNLHGN